MAENLKQNETESAASEPQMLTNDYGTTRDSTVVVEEETRTVLLTDNETIIIEKQPTIDVVPKNRPRRIYAGMWGSAEIATVGLGMLAVLSVIILFVLVVIPAQKELEKNRAERDRLEAELLSARGKYGSITTTEARVAEIVGSANDFETRFLPIAGNGRAALYQNINGLITAYGLVNTSGPEYVPLEISGANSGQQAENEQGKAKYQSIFPGVYVTATVEGSYQNLRRFIREIETSKQFIVISAVELAPSENQGENNAAQQTSISSVNTTTQSQQQQIQPQKFSAKGIPFQNGQMQQQPPMMQQPMMQQPLQQTQTTTLSKPQRGVTHGETVSLRLEMAAYFRRSNVAPTASNPQQY